MLRQGTLELTLLGFLVWLVGGIATHSGDDLLVPFGCNTHVLSLDLPLWLVAHGRHHFDDLQFGEGAGAMEAQISGCQRAGEPGVDSQLTNILLFWHHAP